MAKPGNPRARGNKKGPTVGTGGHGRKALEGKGPTPKATDRSWHVAGKRKAAQDRLDAARAKYNKGGADGGAGKPAQQRRPPKKEGDAEVVTGRNSVVEALRAKIPATTLYIATRLEMDDRVKEALSLAAKRNIPVLEVMRQEIDRMSGPDSVHQGIALKVPAYEYAHPLELLDKVISRGQVPLLVALDGITDPRNLGAIVRSIAAFGGQGAIVPQRRSVGMTASAWKTSAGAAARVPVAQVVNLTRQLKAYQQAGCMVIGLAADGEVSLPDLDLTDGPLVIVVGSEGKGLSRLVAETCDQLVSIPMASSLESLNAGVAASVTLYAVAQQRGAAT